MVKVAAAVQLGQVNRQTLLTSNLLYEQKILFIRGIFMILSDMRHPSSLKKHVQRSLSQILLHEKTEFLDVVFDEIQNLFTSPRIEKQIGGLLAIDSVVNVPLQAYQVTKIIEKYLLSIQQIGEQLCSEHQLLLNDYKNKIESARLTYNPGSAFWQDKSIDKFKVESSSLEEMLIIIEKWALLISKLITIVSVKKMVRQLSSQLLNNSNLLSLLDRFIHQQIPIKEQLENCLISFSTAYQLDSQINSNLVNYLKIISKLISFLLCYRNKDMSLQDKIKSSPFCLMLKKLIPEGVQTLQSLNGFLQKYGELFNEFKVDEAKDSIMKMVSQSLKISELCDYFFSQRVSFVCQFISPLLLASYNTYEDFKRYGISYISELHSFLSFKQSDNIKISAAILTVKYSKYVHGALSFFVRFFLENLHALMNNIPISDGQFQVLSQAEGSLMKTDFDLQQQLDMSIASLISLRHLIVTRKDLMQLLDSFLIANVNQITDISAVIEHQRNYDNDLIPNDNNINNPNNSAPTVAQKKQNLIMQFEVLVGSNQAISQFVLSQFLLLFMELSHVVLKESEGIFQTYLKTVLECSKDWNNLSGFRMQMHMSIYDAAKSSTQAPRLQRYAGDIFSCLLGQLKDCQSEMYFDSLNAVMQTFREQIFVDADSLVVTVGCFVEKIIQTYISLKNSRAKAHMEGIKYPFLILELILSWQDIPMEISLKIDEQLKPLYNLLEVSKEHDISSHILKLYRLQLAHHKGIKSELNYETLFKIKYAFQYEDIFTFEIFKIFNILIQSQPEIVAQKPEILQFILSLSLDGVRTNSRFTGAFDKSISCLIIHLLMHNFNELLTKQNYTEIVQTAVKVLNELFSEQYIETRLVEILLTCIEIDFSLTFSLLTNINIQKLMEILLLKTGIFQEVYDKKLYIIGCCKMLANSQTLPFVQDNFIQLLSNVLEMLTVIKKDQDDIQKQLERKNNSNNNNDYKQPQQNSISQQGVDMPQFEDGPSTNQQDEKTLEDSASNDEEKEFQEIEQYFEENQQTNLNQQTNQANSANKDEMAIFQEDSDNELDEFTSDFKRVYNQSKKNKMIISENPQTQSRKKQLAKTGEQRDVSNMYEDQTEFKKVQKYTQNTFIEELPEIRNCYRLGALEKNSENSFQDLHKYKRAEKSVKLLHTPLKKLDEFTLFKNTFESISAQFGEARVQALLGQLLPYQVQIIRELLHTERLITANQEALEQEAVIRKIVKLKRKQRERELEVQGNSGNNNNNRIGGDQEQQQQQQYCESQSYVQGYSQSNEVNNNNNIE